MLNFNNFLLEAKISAANFNRASELVVKLLAKKTGQKFYRFGGPDGYVENAKGTGILYIYAKNKAIRFNHNGSEFNSITLWKAFKLGRKGDFTVDLGDVNIVSAVDKIIEIVLNPKAGTTQLYVESLNEAARVSPEEFYSMINDALFPGENIASLKWDRLADIALKNDKLIPTAVRKTVTGPRSNKVYDLTQLLSAKNASVVSKDNDPVYSIKVTPTDAITKSFASAKGDARADTIMKTIGSAMASDPTKKEIDVMVKDPTTLFHHMKSLIQVVCRKKRNSLIITGGAGIGKSYTVLQTIGEEGLQKNRDWFLIKGRITTAALYQMLYMHRKNALLVFDDTDSVWGDQDAANVLKAALDSSDERTVSWNSTRTVNLSKMSEDDRENFYDELDAKLDTDPGDNKIKYPSEFEYEGRIIFISNLDQSKLDPAVMNRSTKIDMNMTTAQLFERIALILPNIGSKDVPLDAKEEIFEFIKKNSAAGKLDKPSIRTYVGAEDLYRSGLPNWRDLMAYI